MVVDKMYEAMETSLVSILYNVHSQVIPDHG